MTSFLRWGERTHGLQRLLSVSDPGPGLLILSVKVLQEVSELCLRGCLQDRPPLLLCVPYRLLDLWLPAFLQVVTQTLASALQVGHLGLTLGSGTQNSLKVETHKKRWCWVLETRVVDINLSLAVISG